MIETNDFLDKLGFNGGALRAANSAQHWAEVAEKLNTFNSKTFVAPETRNYQSAGYQYEILVKSIEKFESDLDDDHEIAVQLAAFGQSLIMQVAEISFSNPSLIHFHGYVNGRKSHLVQHVNQLNFLLMAVPKSDPDKPARRIGFAIPLNEESEQE